MSIEILMSDDYSLISFQASISLLKSNIRTFLFHGYFADNFENNLRNESWLRKYQKFREIIPIDKDTFLLSVRMYPFIYYSEIRQKYFYNHLRENIKFCENCIRRTGYEWIEEFTLTDKCNYVRGQMKEFTEDDEKIEDPITYDIIESDNTVCKMNCCKKIILAENLDEWINQSKTTCPMCRTYMFKNDGCSMCEKGYTDEQINILRRIRNPNPIIARTTITLNGEVVAPETYFDPNHPPSSIRLIRTTPSL